MKAFVQKVMRTILNLNRPSKTRNQNLLKRNGETMESFSIREAIPADVTKLAALHVQTWRETYWYHNHSVSYQTRLQQWTALFNTKDGTWFCLVIENKHGQFIGFAKGQHYQHTDLPAFDCELNKIYVLQNYQRLGLGKQLMSAVANRFIEDNKTAMVLFSEAENPSCIFYEALSGQRLYAKNGTFHGGYGWPNLKTITASKLN